MAGTIQQSESLRLSQAGDRVVFNVAASGLATFVATDGAQWGSAVVEVKKWLHGQAVSYSPAVDLSALSTVAEDVDVTDGVTTVVAEVKTADASALRGRVSMTASQRSSLGLDGGGT